MKAAALHPGDPVQVNVRGQVFAATVQRVLATGEVDLQPDQPKRITYRRVHCRRIVKRLERAG